MGILKLMVLLVTLCSFGCILTEFSPEWVYGIDAHADVLSITPDGEYIVVGSGGTPENWICCLNKKGNVLWKYHLLGEDNLSYGYKIQDIKISNNGEYVVASIEYSGKFGIRNNTIYIFNKDGKVVRKYPIKNGLTMISISSDGKYIFAGIDMHCCFIDKDRGILWDYETNDLINSVDITPNGNYAVAGSCDGNIYVFNKSGLLWKYQTNGSVETVSINPNTKLIGAGGQDTYIYLFNYNGTLLNKRSLNYSVYYIKLTDNNIIAYNCMKIYCLNKNLDVLWSYGGNSYYINFIDTTLNGSYIVLYNDYVDCPFLMSNHEGLYVINSTGNVVWYYPADYYVDSVKITDDGKYVVASIGGKIYFFDNQKCIKSYNPNSNTMVGLINNDLIYIIYIIMVVLAGLIFLLILVLCLIKLEKKQKNRQ
ncbi:WD40 repeat domain-containing protein [Methanotorris formicicus]|uniref:WD40 repeat, subgroup n=1 Tax=Methanotorris formicicus Mc-S-70 TaxID=647171 RepID=H1KXI3_9EURY|nr:hypothetical protein [Methanotorris formicicus]EHP88286.1 WD40 repeat, subgroup [Methanotorris formicicus Mc-S-70]